MRETALVVSGAVIAAVGVRVLLVSRGDVSSYRALLQYSDPVPLLLSVAPPTLMFATVGSLGHTLRQWHDGESSGLRLLVTGSGAALAMSFIYSAWQWLLLVGLLLVSLVCFLLIRSEDDVAKGRVPHSRARSAAVFAAGVGLLGATFGILRLLASPWLPAETLTLESGDEIVGYVLDEPNDDVLFLRDDDRVVLRLPSSTIESRSICARDGQSRPIVMAALSPGNSPKYPDCP